ncbi:MAG: hypothetical protein WCB15_11230 [Desulfobacterales bacterium]
MMSEDSSTHVSKDAAVKKGGLHRFLGIYEIVIIVLIVLSILGIGITDFSPADSYKYWVAMVPIFCGACLILEWSRVRGKGFKWTTILRTQLLHWAGLLVAVRLVFEMLHKGRLDNENTGLVILLLLALSVFLAGIHLGWRLCLVGGFLGAALVAATYIEEYVWVLVIIGLAVLIIVSLWKHFVGSEDG